MEKSQENFSLESDTVDLLEFLRLVLRWKWVVIGLIGATTFFTYLYLKSLPVTYTAAATLRIGRIAGVPIEHYSRVLEHLKKIDGSLEPLGRSNLRRLLKEGLLFIRVTTSNREASFEKVKNAANEILKLHERVFDTAMAKIERKLRSSQNIISPEYILESYTYKSYPVGEPAVQIGADDRGIAGKLLLAMISSAFISIVGIFLFEQIVKAARPGAPGVE